VETLPVCALVSDHTSNALAQLLVALKRPTLTPGCLLAIPTIPLSIAAMYLDLTALLVLAEVEAPKSLQAWPSSLLQLLHTLPKLINFVWS